MKGILGRKAGMTNVFSEEGKALPVTVIEVQPNVVLQVKTIETDGYNSVKLGAFNKKEQRANKAELAIAKKAKTSPKYFVKEIRDMVDYEVGQVLNGSTFEVGEYIDVTGTSKGKGFQGSIKRHNYSTGPMGHGSKYHRGSGSIGTIAQTPWKGSKGPGRMGGDTVTMQNLVVVDVDVENNLVLVKGSIPGPNKSFVIIKDSIKKENDTVPTKLVDVKEVAIKNELLEEAKKVGAEVNSAMSISEMKDIIAKAALTKEAEDKERVELHARVAELKLSKTENMNLEELREAVAKGEIVEAKTEAKEAPTTEETKADAEVKEEDKEAMEEIKEAIVTPEDKVEEVKEEQVAIKEAPIEAKTAVDESNKDDKSKGGV